jgi:hypothetical protein
MVKNGCTKQSAYPFLSPPPASFHFTRQLFDHGFKPVASCKFVLHAAARLYAPKRSAHFGDFTPVDDRLRSR